MPPALPPILSSCFDQCLASPSQSLVTSVLNASGNWLVIRLLSAAIHGTVEQHRSLHKELQQHQDGSHVVFMSFVRPLELWTEIGKKINLDIASLITTQRLVYIDGLTGQSQSNTKTSVKGPSLRSHSLDDISSSIAIAKQSLTSAATTVATKTVLIVDGIDFVLASQPDVDQPRLSRFLLSLQESFTNVFVTASADNSLLHNTDAMATALELNHGMFLRAASHQSDFVLQIRPLETGYAKDVTGVFRFSRGGASSGIDGKLADGEWLYQAKGDGSLRLWARGE